MVLYGVTAYNLFETLLLNFGYLNENDMADTEKIIFKEYTNKMMIIRGGFFLALFILSIPNLL